MELPWDVVDEVGKYLEPSVKFRTRLAMQGDLFLNVRERVHLYNLKTLTGVRLFRYIFHNSLHYEFATKDWTYLFNEIIHTSKDSVDQRFFKHHTYYLSEGQINIVKDILTRYREMIYMIPELYFVYEVAAIHKLIPIEEVDEKFKIHYLTGLLSLDDPKDHHLIDKNDFYDIKQLAIDQGAYNYIIKNKIYVEDRDVEKIIVAMYYTPEKKNMLKKLLSKKLNPRRIFHWRGFYDPKHPHLVEKQKIIYDFFFKEKYEEIVHEKLDLYVDYFLARGDQYTFNEKDHKIIQNSLKSNLRRVDDVAMFLKYLKFFKNLLVSDFIPTTKSPVVYQYILDNYPFNLEEHKGIHRTLLPLLRDYMFENVKSVDVSFFSEFSSDARCFNFLEEMSTHYNIKIEYGFHTDLPKALKEYDGTDDALLKILFNYNTHLNEIALPFDTDLKIMYTDLSHVHVYISEEFFTKALELCQDPEKIIKAYSNPHRFLHSDSDITRCHNFLKAFAKKYHSQLGNYIEDIIIDSRFHGLLELFDFDKDHVKDLLEDIRIKVENEDYKHKRNKTSYYGSSMYKVYEFYANYLASLL